MQKLGQKAPLNSKQVLNQLAKSQQIRRAVKGVVSQSSDLPAAAGAHIMRQVAKAATAPSRSRKRLPSADDDDDDVVATPATKRARLAPGFSSRIGYRNKQILRGGTRQQRGGGSCLLYTSPSPRDLSTSRMPSSA